MWEIETSLIQDWLLNLNDDDYDLVIAALEVLRSDGPGLGRPLVDTLTGSRHKNLKELRPGSSGRTEIRILFAFDPRRQAILLVAGDKAGAWKKWYSKNIPIAEERFDAHLHALRTTPPATPSRTRGFNQNP
ncbi:diaminopimelate decarboxylase [Micrococcus luteus]|uniref:type II toxin-antitoxin system RelE/ParE family toxin n=1 Tax=Micrococcus luteus TaxID=1270 RepID=UPI000BAC8D40|nr:type II toxin-antitoxin system RelE/ParE family toxin [Micrococcus luteus]PAW31190.1 diaminopimelate decarboxylase [Micrococcus luteus]PAW31222.1 diaminopimelate decarboxylase [Micrococcus luteus]